MSDRNPERVALIAGAGELPAEAAYRLRAENREVVLVRFDGITDTPDTNFDRSRPGPPGASAPAHSEVCLPLGQMERLLQVLREQECRDLLLVGKFDPALLTSPESPLRPDALAFELLALIRDRGDDELMNSIADWLVAREYRLLDQRLILSSLLMEEGVITKARPDQAALADLAAMTVLGGQANSSEDVQCSVLKDGDVQAQESALGTDEAIRRGASQSGPGATVIKRTRRGQDLRFDLPTIGPDTISTMIEVGARALALEAGRSLILNRDLCVAEANRAGIAIWGFAPLRVVS